MQDGQDYADQWIRVNVGMSPNELMAIVAGQPGAAVGNEDEEMQRFFATQTQQTTTPAPVGGAPRAGLP